MKTCAALVLTSLVWAQQPAVPDAAASVEGTVVNAGVRRSCSPHSPAVEQPAVPDAAASVEGTVVNVGARQ
jgi:hypothetical protein